MSEKSDSGNVGNGGGIIDMEIETPTGWKPFPVEGGPIKSESDDTFYDPGVTSGKAGGVVIIDGVLYDSNGSTENGGGIIVFQGTVKTEVKP